MQEIRNGMRPVHPGEVLREEFLKPLAMSAYALAIGPGAEVLRQGEAPLAHLVAQRALLGAQQEAADQQDGHGEQRDEAGTEHQPREDRPVDVVGRVDDPQGPRADRPRSERPHDREHTQSRRDRHQGAYAVRGDRRSGRRIGREMGAGTPTAPA